MIMARKRRRKNITVPPLGLVERRGYFLLFCCLKKENA